MKAFLLAAGLGTRLRPITNSIPKCLVPICGKPLLGWWIELFERHNINEVLINLHHFPEQVQEYLAENSGNVRFTYFYEESLLGSGGTLRENKNFVRDEETFLICYADNLTNFDLTSFEEFHRENNTKFSMALVRAANPSACGIASLDGNNTIIEFEEKPKHPKSNLANAGIYAAHPSILDLIPDYGLTDVGYHLLPKLVGKMKGLEMSDYLLDIGTLENLARAEREWSSILN
jgi:mannose-1-phosphate guanylyltransferase